MRAIVIERGESFEVIRIDAQAVLANVMDLRVRWDITVRFNVRRSMRQPRSAVDRPSAIAT